MWMRSTYKYLPKTQLGKSIWPGDRRSIPWAVVANLATWILHGRSPRAEGAGTRPFGLLASKHATPALDRHVPCET